MEKWGQTHKQSRGQDWVGGAGKEGTSAGYGFSVWNVQREGELESLPQCYISHTESAKQQAPWSVAVWQTSAEEVHLA